MCIRKGPEQLRGHRKRDSQLQIVKIEIVLNNKMRATHTHTIRAKQSKRIRFYWQRWPVNMVKYVRCHVWHCWKNRKRDGEREVHRHTQVMYECHSMGLWIEWSVCVRVCPCVHVSGVYITCVNFEIIVFQHFYDPNRDTSLLWDCIYTKYSH